VEAGLRNFFLGGPLPNEARTLWDMTDPGVDRAGLEDAFTLPDEQATATVQLLVAEGMVGAGNASAVTLVELGPRQGDARQLLLEWFEPRVYADAEPGRRLIHGLWRVDQST
jgi:hypothetical protein